MIKRYFDKLPYKKNYVIAAFVIWNLLFMPIIIEIFKNYDDPDFGWVWLPPITFAFTTCIVILLSKGFQKQILKKGKNFKDIRKDVFLISFLMLGFLVLQLRAFFLT